MSPRFLRSIGLRSVFVTAVFAALAGCGPGTGAASRPPTSPPVTSPPATAALAASALPVAATTLPTSATPSDGTLYRTSAFDVGLSIMLPVGWKVGVDEAGMFTAYLLTTGDIPDVGVDIQIVPVVHKDPCDPNSGPLQQGFSAADLAAWMLAYKPLAATAAAPATIDKSKAIVIDEAFAGTPCLNLQLWSTPGGWVDQREQKRYFVFEATGRRMVATIFSPDERFASHVDAAMAVLGSVGFLR